VRSLTQSRFGAAAVKSRRTRSAGRGGSVAAGRVVRAVFARVAPASPSSRIKRATRSRPTGTPSRPSCRQTFSAPYTA
jgi:hypothetical protein